MATTGQDGGGSVYLRAEFDASGIAAGAQEGKAAVKDMATSITQDANNASKSLASIGAGSSASDNINRLKEAFNGVGRVTAQELGESARQTNTFITNLKKSAIDASAVTQKMVDAAKASQVLDPRVNNEYVNKAIAGLQKLASENAQVTTELRKQADAQQVANKATAEAKTQFDNFARSAQTLKIELLSLGKSAVEKIQIRAEVMGLDKNSATKAILADLQATQAQVDAAATTLGTKGITATKGLVEGTRAYNAALRQVPAQITDIVVGLQGGQAPLTVLLQQGGQLRDVFGSVSGAASALGRQLLAIVTPWTVLAGAAAGLGYAIYSASEDAKALNKALILSNGSTGATITELNRYAAALVESGVGAGTATTALTTFIGAGVKASGGLQEITKAAIDLEKFGGAAVDETAKSFAKLSKDPLSSIESLTLATYKQIESLLTQGDQLGATAIAQQAFIDNTNKTAKALAGQEGPLDVAIRSWKEYGAAVGNAAREVGAGLGLLPRSGDSERKDLQSRRDNYASLGYDTTAEDARLAYFKRIDEAQKQTLDNAARETKLRTLLADFDKKDERTVKQKALNQAITDYGTLLDAGQITVAQYATAINKLNEVKDKPKTSGAGGLSDAAKGINLYNDLISKGADYSADYAEKVGLLAAAYAKGSLNATELSAAVKQFNSEQKFAKDEAKAWEEQTKASGKAVAESVKEYEKLVNGYQNAADAAQKSVQKLEDEEKALVIAAAQNISLAQAIEQVEIARLREAQAAQLKGGNQEAADAIKAEITAREKLIGLIGNKDGRDASAKAAKRAVDDWAKAADKIESSITDALMRGFENGKDFVTNLRDTIVNMFKTMVLTPVVSYIVSPVAQGITGAMLGGAAGDAAAAGVSGDTTTNAVAGASILSSVGGWFSDFSLASTNAVYELGGTLTKMGAESAGSMVTANATAISGFATTAGYALAAISAVDAASRGKWGQALGTGIGALWGPLASMVGGAVGSAIDNAFGGGSEYTTGTGIKGKLTAGAFSGNKYQTWQNDGSSGLFGIGGSGSSSGTNLSALDAATQSGLSRGFAAIQIASAGMAVSLGLNAKAIAGYSQDVTVALTSDAAANKKAIDEMFNGVADKLATTLAANIDTYAKLDETSSVTLARLSSSIVTTNAWLTLLKQRLFQVSLAGADAASKLADAFGGLDKLTASSQAFYETYYTAGEKVAASQTAMTAALAEFGIALPKTKDQFKQVALSLDLNTESGRAAYATLLKLAPEFATTSDLIAQASKEAATAILKTFTANGQLIPALDSTALSMLGVQKGVDAVVGGMTQIRAVMGDVTSPILTFSGSVGTLSTGLTGAQASSLSLKDQIEALSGASSKAVIDFGGLTGALANVNFSTFIEAVSMVFESLAARISDVVGSITTERVAVREAALQIINPSVMSKQSIQAGIAGIGVSLPSNAALVAANANLASANAGVNSQAATLASAQASAASTRNAQSALIASVNTGISGIDALVKKYGLQQQTASGGQAAQLYVGGSGTLQNMDQYQVLNGGSTASYTAFKAEFWKAGGVYDQTYGKAAELQTLANELSSKNATVSGLSDSSAVKSVQTAAATAAAKALLDYQKALQGFALDAGKSVSKLSNLRQETVKYYEAQKALADLMQTSAENLLGTVANYRFQQLTPEAQSASLQSQFSSAYSMALAAQGDGNSLATYGDKLNSTLGPLIDSLKATGQDNLINSFLAQAEKIAQLLQDTAPQNYAKDSLDMLGSIDATLAALDASSKSAEQVISDAVTAGSDRTAAGLYAVIQAITGKTVPAFAAGGSYGGGLALVGENGPEMINFDQPGQVYNAAQTQGMFGGNNRLESLVAAQGAQLEAMSYELRAIATSSSKTSKILERVTPDGVSLQTVAA